MSNNSKTQINATISSELVKNALSAVTTLVDEATVHFDEDGLQVNAVDEANVGMATVIIDSSAFEKYETDDIEFVADISRIEDIAKKAQEDHMTFLYEESSGFLRLEVGGYKFKLGLLDEEENSRRNVAKNLSPPATIHLSGRMLRRLVNTADMFSDQVIFGIDEQKPEFYVKATGDTDNMSLRLDENKGVQIEPAAANSIFSLDYLTNISKAIPAGVTVSIGLGVEFPTQISFSIADDECEITYGLAPRIE